MRILDSIVTARARMLADCRVPRRIVCGPDVDSFIGTILGYEAQPLNQEDFVKFNRSVFLGMDIEKRSAPGFELLE